MLGKTETGATAAIEPHIWSRPLPSYVPPATSPQAHHHARRYLSAGEYRLLPFTVDAKPMFDSHLRNSDFVVADLSFTNNFIWLSRMSGFYQIIADCFCLFSLNGNQLGMLLPPIGTADNQLRALRICIAIMDDYNNVPADSRVDYVTPEFARLLEIDNDGTTPFLPHGPWQLEPAFPDYIYRSVDLIELRGNNYKTKRSEINQFCRAYPHHAIEPLQHHHWQGIRELLSNWMRARIAGLNGTAVAEFIASVELERQAIERALAHYDALGLQGLCLMIEGRLAGFTIGERLNDSVASILIEKTDFAIPGAAQYLFREFVKTFADCRYINVGDDLGLENMRRVKMSYRPALFAEKFTLRRGDC